MRLHPFALFAAALMSVAAAARPGHAVQPPAPLLNSPSTQPIYGPAPLSASAAIGEHGLHWGLALGMPVATPSRGGANASRLGGASWRVDALFNASHDPALQSPSGDLATSLKVQRATDRFGVWLGASRGGPRESQDPRALLRWGGGIASVLGDLKGEVSWVRSTVLFNNDPRWSRSWTEFVPVADRLDSTMAVERTEYEPHETFWQTAQATLGWERGRFSVDGVGGLSLGEGVSARRWAQARMGLRISRHVGMLAAWGERPSAALAFEGNAPPRTMLGLEVRPWAPRLGPAKDSRTEPMSEWQSVPTGRGTLILRVRARDAKSVELMSDLTDWVPTPMIREMAGWWAVEVSSALGLHRVQVRADGGAWLPPPGLPRAADADNGPAGVLFVSGDR